MAHMTTRDTVLKLLRRIGEEPPERIAELYAPTVDWRLDWPEDEHGARVPWIRERSTRADVAEHYRELREHHLPELAWADVSSILVDGADAVVLGTLGQTRRADGVAYSARFALHLTVAGGLLTRHHVYEDSLAVARAFYGTVPAAG